MRFLTVFNWSLAVASVCSGQLTAAPARVTINADRVLVINGQRVFRTVRSAGLSLLILPL